MPKFDPVALRLALLQVGVCLVIGVHLPFFPLWLKGRGLDPTTIGLVLALALAARAIAGPALGFLADRQGDRRPVLAACGVVFVATALVMPWAEGFWPLLLVSLALGGFLSGAMPITEALSVWAAQARGFDYGRVRIWGSMTFILANIVMGALIARAGDALVPWGILWGGLLVVATAWLVPRETARLATGASEGGSSAAGRLSWREAVALLREPVYALFLVAACSIQASHALYYNFSVIGWQARGISPETIGLLWGFAVVGEVVLFTFARKVVARVGAIRLILIGAVGATLRWSLMATAPGVGLLVLCQLAHSASFGAAHIGAMHFLARAAPARLAATAQGVYAAVAGGILIGLLTLVGGALFEAVGPRAYLAAAGLAGIGIVGTVLLARSWNGERMVLGSRGAAAHASAVKEGG